MLCGKLKASLLADRNPLMVVGSDTIILVQRHDQNQHWFDFMRGVIFEAYPPAAERVEHKKPKVTKYARVPERCAKLFVYSKGVEQFCLPFPDRLKISNSQIQALSRAHFPGWDRLSDGTVPYVFFERGRKAEIEEWCMKNCMGSYYLSTNNAAFQHAKEYILARMMFGEK